MDITREDIADGADYALPGGDTMTVFRLAEQPGWRIVRYPRNWQRPSWSPWVRKWPMPRTVAVFGDWHEVARYLRGRKARKGD